jgi:adenylylsulfate kinase-like enzyme
VTALSDERDLPRSVLVTGVYGAGKSTVVQDLAILLEEAGVPYAAIDLDWLSWYDAGVDGDDGWDMLLANLAAVAGNYRSAGVTRFVMAGFFESAADVERLRSVLAMPVATVRLEVPLTVVEQRLSAEGTAERLANLDEARRQLAEGRGLEFADLAVAGDRPTREISLDILNWLGWLG